MPEPKYISIPELAKILNISRIAVYKKVKKGEIEAIRVGRNYAISQEYIMDHMSEMVKKVYPRKRKKEINQAVDKAFDQYKETFIRLGKE